MFFIKMDKDNSSQNNSRSLSRKRFANKTLRILNLNQNNLKKNSILNISDRTSKEQDKLNKKCSFTRLITSSVLTKKPYLISRKPKINIKNNNCNPYSLLSISNEYINSHRTITKQYKSSSTINTKDTNLSNCKNIKMKFHQYKSSNNILTNTCENANNNINKNNYLITTNNNNNSSLNFLYSINLKSYQRTKFKKRDNNNNYYFFVNNSINIQKNSIIPKTRIFFHNHNDKNNKINFKTIKNSRSYNTIVTGMKKQKNELLNNNSSFGAKKIKKSPKNSQTSPDNSLKENIKFKNRNNANSIRMSKNEMIHKRNYIIVRNNLAKNNNNINSNNITNYNNSINTNVQRRNINRYLLNIQKPNKLIRPNSGDNNLIINLNLDNKNSKVMYNNKKIIKRNIERQKNKEKRLRKNKSHKDTIEITFDNCMNNKKTNVGYPVKAVIYNKTDTNENINQEKENIISLEKDIKKDSKKKKMIILSNKYVEVLEKINKDNVKKITNEAETNKHHNNLKNIKTGTYDLNIPTQMIHNRKINIDKNNKCINKNNRSKSKSLRNSKVIKFKENVKRIREIRKKKRLLISFKNKNKVELMGIKEIFSNFCKIDYYNKCKTPKENNYYNSKFKNFNFLTISKKITKTQQISTDKLFMPNMKDKFQLNKNIFNPQYNYEYINDILENLLIEENNYFEKINMNLANNEENKFAISPESRKFFINSLINIQDVLSIREQTLFLTVQIFDRYINEILAKEGNIVEENLDIVIVCSLIIAAKREEIKLYSMADYLNLLPEKYTLKDVIEQEFKILAKLKFELLTPNALNFYEIFATKCKFDKTQMFKGLYLLNIAMMDSNMLQIPSSLIAYSVVKIISKANCEGLIDKINNNYECQGIIKDIKIIPIFKDDEIIDNLCNFIRYTQKNLKDSAFKSIIGKFNKPSRHFVSSCVDF